MGDFVISSRGMAWHNLQDRPRGKSSRCKAEKNTVPRESTCCILGIFWPGEALHATAVFVMVGTPLPEGSPASNEMYHNVVSFVYMEGEREEK